MVHHHSHHLEQTGYNASFLHIPRSSAVILHQMEDLQSNECHEL